MTDPELRKLYDDIDNMCHQVKNVGAYAYQYLPDIYWENSKEYFEALMMNSELLLSYMANRIIPEIEKHPEDKKFGVYIDGVKQ